MVVNDGLHESRLDRKSAVTPALHLVAQETVGFAGGRETRRCRIANGPNQLNCAAVMLWWWVCSAVAGRAGGGGWRGLDADMQMGYGNVNLLALLLVCNLHVPEVLDGVADGLQMKRQKATRGEEGLGFKEHKKTSLKIRK